MAPEIHHAGLVALRRGGVWSGVLIVGPSGSGKSDLALRCLEAGFALVADDRVVVFVSEGRLYGRAPGPLAGLIECRGVGIMPQPATPFARIDLVARCEASPGEVERLPEPAHETLLGLAAPLLRLWPFEGSAPAKLRRALEALGRGEQEAYQASLAPPRRRLGA
ncbi:MAG: HPr kinase/phosphorylase [Proteobacteria bacterium]|nr:HPr kinase/phosphorylase [Pseudomonadota bacterium]